MRGRQISRRSVLKGGLMASVIGGTGSFFGPWREEIMPGRKAQETDPSWA